MLEQAEKEKRKRAEQLQQANADLARQAAMIRDLQAHPRGKKEKHETGPSLDQASCIGNSAVAVTYLYGKRCCVS